MWGTNNRLDQIESDIMRANVTLKEIKEAVEKVRVAVLGTQVEIGETIRVHQAWTRTIVDSLVEFTLAKSGQPQAAAMHRSQVRLERTAVVEEPVVPDPKEQWPPPGYILGRSKG